MIDKKEIVLSLHNVGVHYRRRVKTKDKGIWALKDISFDLYKGETLGVIGRNGVGKSTLLRVLAGIIEPDRGNIINQGSRVSLLSLQVGFVAHLTGRENAILSAMLLGMRRDVAKNKLNEIIDFSGIGDFIDEPVGNYSSGMRARLGFAVSFAVQSDILLIDEVLGVGDDEFKKKSTAAMKERIKSSLTVVIVAHDIRTIRENCDRVLWLDKGIIVAEGKTEDVLSSYQNVNRRAEKR